MIARPPRSDRPAAAPYSGPPALRVKRTLLAVQRGTISPRYFIRDLKGGETLRDDEGMPDAYVVLEDAIDAARATGSLVYHDYPTFDAAFAAANA